LTDEESKFDNSGNGSHPTRFVAEVGQIHLRIDREEQQNPVQGATRPPDMSAPGMTPASMLRKCGNLVQQQIGDFIEDNLTYAVVMLERSDDIIRVRD
jgi:hypothetical protein